MGFRPMVGGKALVGEHGDLGFVQEGGELARFESEPIGAIAPPGRCCLVAGLGVGSFHESGDHAAAVLVVLKRNSTLSDQLVGAAAEVGALHALVGG